MVINLDHIAISVSDMERSLEFYRDILGLEVIKDSRVYDGSIGKVIDVPNAKCRIVHLKLDNAFIELFEYCEPRGQNVAKTLNQYDHALIHFAFEVDCFDEFISRLKKKGVELVGEPVEFRLGIWCVYFRGPDGEMCAIRHQEKN